MNVISWWHSSASLLCRTRVAGWCHLSKQEFMTKEQLPDWEAVPNEGFQQAHTFCSQKKLWVIAPSVGKQWKNFGRGEVKFSVYIYQSFQYIYIYFSLFAHRGRHIHVYICTCVYVCIYMSNCSLLACQLIGERSWRGKKLEGTPAEPKEMQLAGTVWTDRWLHGCVPCLCECVYMRKLSKMQRLSWQLAVSFHTVIIANLSTFE